MFGLRSRAAPLSTEIVLSKVPGWTGGDDVVMRLVLDPSQFTTLIEYVRAQPCPYTRAELIAAWTTHQFDAARARGALARPFPGVFCATEYVTDPALKARAVGMWLPAGVITGEAALSLRDPRWPAPARWDIAVDAHARLPPHPGVRAAYRAQLPAHDEVQGARVARIGPAFVDAWTRRVPALRTDLFYRALWRRVVKPAPIARELDQRWRVADRRVLKTLVDEARAGRDSWLESMARREVFTEPEFRDFEFQVEIATGRAQRRADMCHRQAGVVIEFDGRADHETVAGVRSDRQRDAELAAAGYVTLRFGYLELRDEPQRCRRLVRETVDLRQRTARQP